MVCQERELWWNLCGKVRYLKHMRLHSPKRMGVRMTTAEGARNATHTHYPWCSRSRGSADRADRSLADQRRPIPSSN